MGWGHTWSICQSCGYIKKPNLEKHHSGLRSSHDKNKHSSSSALQHLQLHLHREVASFPYKIQHVDHDGVRRLHEYERAGCEFHNNCEEHNTLK